MVLYTKYFVIGLTNLLCTPFNKCFNDELKINKFVFGHFHAFFFVVSKKVSTEEKLAKRRSFEFSAIGFLRTHIFWKLASVSMQIEMRKVKDYSMKFRT